MSKNKHFISINPPMFLNVEGCKESLCSYGHKCNQCNGNGWFWGDKSGEREKVPCHVCKGSGALDATITIEWKPASNV